MGQITKSAFRSKHSIFRYRVVDYILRAVLRNFPATVWSESIALRWGVKFRPAPRVVRLRSGPLMHVNPTDYLQLLIYYLGTFEPHCMPYLRGCVAKGAIVVDVGANVGIYTLESAILVGSTGRVISIEPAPTNARSLQKNIELNRLTNVTLFEVAAGDTVCSAKLSLASGGNLGMFSLATAGDDTSCNVEVRRIDDLIEQSGVNSVSLMKMDIEGSEYRGLRGAIRTLRRFRPVILIELNEEALRSCQSSINEVIELLAELDYRGWIIDRVKARPIRQFELIPKECECLFINCNDRPLMRRLKLPDCG
jgi:FkbM family methyltransferase